MVHLINVIAFNILALPLGGWTLEALFSFTLIKIIIFIEFVHFAISMNIYDLIDTFKVIISSFGLLI